MGKMAASRRGNAGSQPPMPMIELRLSGAGTELEWEPGETLRLPLPLTGRELEARVVLETEDLPRLKRAVPSSDPSARFVTLERYLKAGGTVTRVLPSDDPRDVEGRLGLLAREIDVTLWHFEAAQNTDWETRLRLEKMGEKVRQLLREGTLCENWGDGAAARMRSAARRATIGKMQAAQALRDRLRSHVFKALDQHPKRKWTIAKVLQTIPAGALQSESASLSTLRRCVGELMKEHASAQDRTD
jgi:hypothetical protein